MAQKKPLPKFDSNSLPTDFFSTGGNVIMDSVNKSAQEIEALHHEDEAIPEETNTQKKEKKTQSEKSVKNITKEEKSGGGGRSYKSESPRRKDNKPKNNEDEFLSFIAAGRSRKDTQPVRITKQNYDRIIAMRDHLGGSRGVPEIVDKILEMYLDMVEKQL